MPCSCSWAEWWRRKPLVRAAQDLYAGDPGHLLQPGFHVGLDPPRHLDGILSAHDGHHHDGQLGWIGWQHDRRLGALGQEHAPIATLFSSCFIA